MEEKYLQAGFEIKLACDAISRRLLRWHWEKTPRPNSLRELMRYVEQRSGQAPDYYLNVGAFDSAATWQKLDTTFCMRVLLDTESNVAKPKRLLQYALQEKAARRACNGLRLARNAAAHATEKADVAKAIAIFDETIADLEEGYGMALFTAEELEEYDALVKTATAACVGGAARKKAAGTANNSGTKARGAAASKANNTRSKTAGGRQKNSASARNKASAAGRKEANNAPFSRELGFVILAAIVFIAAICAQWAR